MRRLVYIMLISNNRTEKNLVKHQNMSKYYKTDCGLSVNGTLVENE